MASRPATTQDDPTAPRPVANNGLVLDAWGLPLCGPARVAALAGGADPALQPPAANDTPTPDAGNAGKQD